MSLDGYSATLTTGAARCSTGAATATSPLPAATGSASSTCRGVSIDYLREAWDQPVIVPDTIVVAGDAGAPAVVEVVEMAPNAADDRPPGASFQATSRTTLHCPTNADPA